MEKKLTFREKVIEVFLALVGALILVLFVVLVAVIFDERVEYWAKGVFSVRSKDEVIYLIRFGMGTALLILVVFMVIGVMVQVIERVRAYCQKVKAKVISHCEKVKAKLRVHWEKMKASWRVDSEKLVARFLLFVRALGVALFILIFLIMFFEHVECWAKDILGVRRKREAIELIGWGIAGILGFFGAIAVNRRADAQVDIARSESRSAEEEIKNNELREKGYIQERLEAAVEHLGNDSETVRIASFYEFSHLASDNKELRRNIFDILCAHLRYKTPDKESFKKAEFVDEGEIPREKPTVEVQSLLDVLFRFKNNQGKLIFAEFPADLRGISLVRANLSEAKLQGADLQGADLRGVNLYKTDLRDARLVKAKLQESRLYKTDLRGAVLLLAVLIRADLDGADLGDVDLRGANLGKVKNLRMANLKGVDARGALRPEGFDWPEGVSHD